MDSSQPISARDASQIAAGGCIVSIPVALYAGFRWALKSAEAKEHALSHQVEEVELEERATNDASGAHLIPAEESLTRFVTTLRRITAPFDKMSARFEPAIYEAEVKRLQSLKKRFASEGQPASPEAQKLLQEADQLLARYAPGKP